MRFILIMYLVTMLPNTVFSQFEKIQIEKDTNFYSFKSNSLGVYFVDVLNNSVGIILPNTDKIKWVKKIGK